MTSDPLSTASWFALFGEIERLVGSEDCVLVEAELDDELCLRLEATARSLHRFQHDDLDGARAQICHLRSSYATARIFVLASARHDEDRIPSELWRLQEACHRYGAMLMLERRSGPEWPR